MDLRRDSSPGAPPAEVTGEAEGRSGEQRKIRRVGYSSWPVNLEGWPGGLVLMKPGARKTAKGVGLEIPADADVARRVPEPSHGFALGGLREDQPVRGSRSQRGVLHRGSRRECPAG